MHWLLALEELKEKPLAGVVEGDLIFYFDNGQFKHVGILTDPEWLISKWGEGHLLEHRIWEVPACYGDEVRVFSPLNADEAYHFFTIFAEENGIAFQNAHS